LISGEETLRRPAIKEEPMSEYQFVAFRAIDGPVSKKNLAYMRRQSTRAEITSRSFVNEYQYGDFRGNALEMLRLGYDIHLHYANFGTRSLFIRLPHGFPDSKAAKPYLDGESIRFIKDKVGTGGTLAIEPSHEPGDLEELWDIERWLDRLAPLRSEILQGDLRPLYLGHLAVSCDIEHDPEETIEAPLPAGLESLTKAQRALAELYEISDAMVTAAVQEIGPPPTVGDSNKARLAWLHSQPASQKEAWLAALMRGPSSKVRADILEQFRKDRPGARWPTVELGRTIADLRQTASEIQQAIDERSAAEAARKRANKLAKMADDPKPYLDQTEKLVAQRTTAAYDKVGRLLADLHEALIETDRTGVAEQQAEKLTKKHPTLRHLTAALRRKGFVSKQVSVRKTT
jgi:hypothetical protein